MENLFVSAFLEVYSDRKGVKQKGLIIDKFIKLAESGIDIVLFISPEIVVEINEIIVKYPNVRIHKVLTLEQTWTWKIFNKTDLTLPSARNIIKDTKDYMTLMNCKLEFINEIIQDPLYSNYTGFGWIDFSLFHIIAEENVKNSQKELFNIANKKIDNDILYIQGCLSKPVQNIDYLYDKISWRFCGGIFIGSKKNVYEFCQLYINNIESLTLEKNRLIWEVNIWAIMEIKYDWKPTWLQANHNQTILSCISRII